MRKYMLFSRGNFSFTTSFTQKVDILTDLFLFVLIISSQYLLKGYWYVISKNPFLSLDFITLQAWENYGKRHVIRSTDQIQLKPLSKGQNLSYKFLHFYHPILELGD